MNEDITKLIEAARGGDATAFIPLADSMMDAGHKHGEEMVELARNIFDEEDWSVVTMSIAVFMKLMEDG